MGAGGSNIEVEEKDAPSAPGKKAVVSSDIPEVDAGKLLESMEKYVRAGKTLKPRSAQHTITDEDGGVLIKEVFEIPAMFGGGEFIQFNLFKFNQESGTVEISYFPSEFFYSRKEVQQTHWIKVLTAPVRIEFWTDAHPVRASGKLMLTMLNKVLGHLKVPESGKIDQPALTGEGFSVLSDPIEGSEVTAENYFEQFRDFLVNEMNATELPDGAIIEERSSVLGDIGIGTASYAKHIFNKEENHLYCHEYGEDESMQEELSVTHVQVHKDPFRLEQWNVQKEQRLTGPAQQKMMKEFVLGVLKYMEEA